MGLARRVQVLWPDFTARPLTDPIVVGRINGLFGTHGWVKAFSYTRPRENLLDYTTWYLRNGRSWQAYALGAAKRHGSGLIASLNGVEDRDTAATLLRCDIAIERQQLAVPATGEYYWADLIGLHVVNREGEPLGRVAGLIDTGANDVLRVEGLVQRLIPFVEGVYIDEINWEAAEIRVDWHVDD